MGENPPFPHHLKLIRQNASFLHNVDEDSTISTLVQSHLSPRLGLEKVKLQSTTPRDRVTRLERRVVRDPVPGRSISNFIEELTMIQGTHAILRLISLHLRGEMPSFLISTSIPYLAKDESKDDRYRTSRTVYDLTSQPYNDFYIAGAGCHRSVEYFFR